MPDFFFSYCIYHFSSWIDNFTGKKIISLFILFGAGNQAKNNKKRKIELKKNKDNKDKSQDIVKKSSTVIVPFFYCPLPNMACSVCEH